MAILALEHALSTNHVPGLAASNTPQWVCLSGFMGSGKTTVGKALAEELRWPFFDLDELIVSAEGRSISDIFQSDGEPAFRRMEAHALAGLLARRPPAVVALGGGAFIQEENRELLRQSGALTVFLDADPVMLFERCCAEGPGRPLLRSREAFLDLYEQRRPIYLKAGLVVSVEGRTPRQIAGEIARQITVKAAVSD